MPRPTAAVYRRRRFGILGGAGLVLILLGYLPMTLLAPVPSASAVIAAPAVTAGTASAPLLPHYGASGFTSPDMPDLTVTAGSTDALPLASITKIVTVLTVLDAKPIAPGGEGARIPLTAADAKLATDYRNAGGKIVAARAGWVFTEREMMQIALMESANNYAASLAVWAFGSPAGFVTAAKTWLAGHGLDGITIVEPTGLDVRNTGTARALLTLGRLALADPTVAAIVDTATADIHDVGKLTNSNGLLGSHADGIGVDGIKTGTLAGVANLLFSAELTVGDARVTVIGIALGGPDHTALDADVSTMLASIRAGFHWIPVATVGQSFASYATRWGSTAEAVADEDAGILTWGDTPVRTEVTTDPITTEAADGDVGQVTFTAGDRTTTVPLRLSGRVEDPGVLWRLGHPFALL